MMIKRFHRSKSNFKTEPKISHESLALANILDQTLDCIYIFTPDTLLFVYTNRGARKLVGYSEAEMLRMTLLNILPTFDEADFRLLLNPLLDGTQSFYSFEAVLSHKEGQAVLVEIHLKWVELRPNESRFVAIVRDITERKTAEKSIGYLSRIYSALAQSNQAIARCEDEMTLFREVCRIAVEFGGMKMSWIGLEGASDLIQPIAAFGNGTDYLEEILISSRVDLPEGQGATGIAFRENHPVIIQDFGTDERVSLWQKRAQPYGWGASAAFPLLRGGRTYAVLTVYHEDSDIFDQKMVDLLNEMALDISYALDKLDLAAERRRALEALTTSEAFNRHLIELSIEGICVTNAAGRITFSNQRMNDLLGYTPAEMLGHPLGEFIITDEINDQLAKIEAQRGRSCQSEWRCRCKDGRTIWVLTASTPLFDPLGEFSGSFAMISDISERKRAEEAILEVQQRLTDIIEFLPDATFVIDRNRTVIAWNRAMEIMTGIHSRDMLGKRDYEYALPFYGSRRPVLIDLAFHFDEEKAKEYPLIFWRQGDILVGETYTPQLPSGKAYLWCVASILRDSKGEAVGAIESIRDITERKAANEQIEHLAHFDFLTGLPNRTLLTERVMQTINKVQHKAESFTLMFLDLDHFKNINDTLGHRIGDKLLVDLAERLKNALSEQNMVSRLGGDEFILLLPSLDADGAEQIAAKLLKDIAQPFYIEEHELTVTPSIGISIFPYDGVNWEELYRSADIAMYHAKQGGRNAYRFFTADMQRSSARRLQLENALQRALERDELLLYYQPQVSLENNLVVGVEALLRWQHPEFGMISPAEFIPLAEDNGSILPIGEWVLRTAVRQMKSWLEAGLPSMTVSVNLSAIQLRQHNLPQLVMQILDEVMLPSKYLELELTESVAMKDPEMAVAMMSTLNERGVRLAIDDFGTGYSSLTYLKRFQINKLKIDKSFVRNITTDPNDEAIVAAVISLAQSLHLNTIAEGVENEDQLQFLRKKGCQEVQGYYYSPPLPPSDFLKWIGFQSA